MSDVLDLRKKNIPEVQDGILYPRIAGEIKPYQQTVNKPAMILIDIVLFFLGIFFLFFQKNIVTAVFFFLIVLVSLVLIYKEKKPVRWEISQRGLMIDGRFYAYGSIGSFWIEFNPPHLKELSFKLKKWYQFYIKIPFENENPITLRRYLANFLQEERHEDTIIEVITRKLGI